MNDPVNWMILTAAVVLATTWFACEVQEGNRKKAERDEYDQWMAKYLSGEYKRPPPFGRP